MCMLYYDCSEYEARKKRKVNAIAFLWDMLRRTYIRFSESGAKRKGSMAYYN